MNKTTFVLIMTFLVLVVLKIGWWHWQQAKLETSATANWQTYSNQLAGFEFKYPPTLTTVAAQTGNFYGVIVHPLGSNDTVFSVQIFTDAAKFNAAHQGLLNNRWVETGETMTIDGEAANKLSDPAGGVVYEIKSKNLAIGVGSAAPNLDQILASFKFRK